MNCLAVLRLRESMLGRALLLVVAVNGTAWGFLDRGGLGTVGSLSFDTNSQRVIEDKTCDDCLCADETHNLQGEVDGMR